MFAADDNYYQYPDCQLSDSQTDILNFDTVLKPKLIVPYIEPPKGFFETDTLNILSPGELRSIFQHHLLLSKARRYVVSWRLISFLGV